MSKVFTDLGLATTSATAAESSIGKFIIAFSNLEMCIHLFICSFLKIHPNIQAVFLAQLNFTAACTLLTEIAKRELTINNAEKAKSLLSQIKNFHDTKRNKIVHGTWTYKEENLINRFQSRNNPKPSSYEEYSPIQILELANQAIMYTDQLIDLFSDAVHSLPPLKEV